MTTQDFLTICCPLKWKQSSTQEQEDRLNELLDGYGNPLGRSIRPHGPVAEHAKALCETLDECARVHFMSISVIPGSYPEEKKSSLWHMWARRRAHCAHLVVEMSVDGSADDAIQELIEKCGKFLLPVFTAAAGIETVGQLKRYLKRHRRKLVAQVPALNPLPKRATGLPFNGAAGLSVDVIKKDALLYDALREELSRLRVVRNKGETGQSAVSDSSMEMYRTLRHAFTSGDFSPEFRAHIVNNGDPEFAENLNSTNENRLPGALGLLALVWFPLAVVGAIFVLLIGGSFMPAVSDDIGFLTRSKKLTARVMAVEFIEPQYCVAAFARENDLGIKEENARPRLAEFAQPSIAGEKFAAELGREELGEYLYHCRRSHSFSPLWDVESDDEIPGEVSISNISEQTCEIATHIDDLEASVFEKTDAGRILRSVISAIDDETPPKITAALSDLRSNEAKDALCHERGPSSRDLLQIEDASNFDESRWGYLRSMDALIAHHGNYFEFCDFVRTKSGDKDKNKNSLEIQRQRFVDDVRQYNHGPEQIDDCLWSPTFSQTAGEYAYFISSLLGTVAAIIVASFLSLLGFGFISWKSLRKSEKYNEPNDFDPDPDLVRQMMLRENRTPAQNHMVSVTTILPVWHRRLLSLPLALLAVRKSVENKWFRSGFLADIGTIHFARWVRLPGTRKLIFFSNYDANWENYLEDFITKAKEGLTGIWSNCEGFPKTENLFLKGAEDGDRFKRWARASMVPTRFWYTAYGDLSIEQIRRNALVRIGLTRDISKTNAKAWLNFFDSDQRPDQILERDEIQTLILRGGRGLLYGKCLAVNFPARITPNQLRDWVREIKGLVTTGDRNTNEALYVSFSAAGLARLGMDEEVRADRGAPTTANAPKFPSAFSLGMHSKSRQNVLGDLEINAPENWDWGQQLNDSQTVHAVVLIYDREDPIVEKLTTVMTRMEDDFGVRTIRETCFEALPKSLDDPIKEPFGWKDGISQPIIRGVGRRDRDDPVNTVEPGEFILGYRDNRGFYPTSPTVKKETDTAFHLQNLPKDEFSKYPNFEQEHEVKLRDFGRNGSFLVIRQLEQDVSEFQRWLEESAEQLKAARETREDDTSYITDEYIGAKVFGRWKDGKPITRWPYNDRMDPDRDGFGNSLSDAKAAAADGSAQITPIKTEQKRSRSEQGRLENVFTYGKTDPQGHACPFGAHIRRANPRDSLNPENENSIAIANRHRILRRGRSYVDKTGQAKGTFFMCLNADIERQFEFIQQNWINAARFHGLDDEVDPITGQYGEADPLTGEVTKYNKFSIPSEHGPDELDGWRSFITMKGGGYFFMPSRSALDYLSEPVKETEEDETD